MKLFKSIANWYFSRDALPYWCVLALDCAILVFFYLFGYYCVLGLSEQASLFWKKLYIVSFCLLPYLVFFRVFHTYANIIRYSSMVDLRNVALANVFASACIVVVRFVFFNNADELLFPGLRVILLAFCFSSLAMCGWRAMVKLLFDITGVNNKTSNIFIYGNKNGAVSIAKSLRSQNPAEYNVRGFIAPGQSQESGYILGIPVYPDDSDLVYRMKKEGVLGVMVSPLVSKVFLKNEELISQLVEAGIRMFMMPEAQEWDGKSDITPQMLHKVEIEDLLPRDEIEVDMNAIGELLKGKSILITGAAGSIGSEMVRQIASFQPREMVLIDQAETPMHDIRRMMAKSYPGVKAESIVTSITNATRMERLFSLHRPDYVFHAAAYKHVPMMEDNPSEAIQNNVYGTRVIADLAVKYGTRKFVMISTDKAVNPTNVMGCSKRICEIYCQSLNAELQKEDCNIRQADGSRAVTQFVTTRFGNVLGSNGSVIPIFREQIRNGGPVTVTHPEIIRYFMLIPEACKLVLEAGTFGRGGEIFVFDMGNPVKIADLAKRMIALSKAKGVEIQYTGLRDGEKLYEEVLSVAETTKPTPHPKIRVAEVRQYPYEEALRNEVRLYEASFNYDDMETVRIMKEIVPEFKSRHSKYEALD